MKTNALSPDLFHRIDADWRAANYLSVGINKNGRGLPEIQNWKWESPHE